MPVTERTKVPGVDVKIPAPLPLLGQQVPDRAPTADATVEASAAAVLAGVMPYRKTGIPFERMGLPSLNDNYRPLRTPLPPESTQPVTSSPRPPQP